MIRKHAWLFVMAIGAFVLACSNAGAHEFRTRFVMWNGSAWVPLAGDRLDATPATAYRIRFEIGVFDDACSPAPAGGFVGWNVGSVSTNGGTNTRTPGCLFPYIFGGSPGCPCRSSGSCPDPFTSLADIDATLGTQSPVWVCGADGHPLPRPPAVIRGLNTYIQIFEMTTVAGSSCYSVTFAGQLIAANSWLPVGTPTDPDCGNPTNPADDIPGAITYAPFPTVPRFFSRTLTVSTSPTGSCFGAGDYRTRVVRWNGSAWAPLCNDTLYASPGSSHRLRLEMGVFDNATGAAPAGGLVGWNVGNVSTGGGTNTRTPGCLTPYYFGGPATCPCRSSGSCPDPFTGLTNIDATLGTQSPVWTCGTNGIPLPRPPAVVRGLNNYVQIFEMTTVVGSGCYTVTFGGNMIAANNWLPVGTPTDPDCGVPANPADDTPGAVTYAPFPATPRAFTYKISISTTPPVDCLGDGVSDTCQTAFTERLYSLTGTSAGTPWSWCINSARFPSVCNLTVPGVPAGQSALVVANAFAASINAQSCPDTQLFASASVFLGTTYLVVDVASGVTGDTPFDLCVGPSGGPASCCPLMAFSSCSFNPTMTRIPTSGADCNGNGRDDTIDILQGRSLDANNDGIPDECQPCPADFNHSGSVTSQDFFDFLAAFFMNLPTADFNHDGVINSQDFFNFLAAFFTGC